MEIIFHGKHNGEEAAENLLSVLRLLKERYHIAQFHEMNLKLTLVNEDGEDVELVDNETSQVYRIFEVYRKGEETLKKAPPPLHLIVDNTQDEYPHLP